MMMKNPRMAGMARKLAEKMHADMMALPERAARKMKRKRKPGGGPPVYRGK